ncbi:MAG TPA: hypothetical protein VFE05_23855 [Longimicrobiaceae bacterium]|jgi:hypothetical protein|nr:hypothetical protein [Longimicrobiaceae bacterium]
MISTFLFLAAAALSSPPHASSRNVAAPAGLVSCPAETERTRAVVTRFLTSPYTSPLRSDYGLQNVSSASVRTLTDAQDAATCQALQGTVQLSSNPYPQITSYFYADGFYFVPVVYVVPPNRNFMGHDGLIVLDQNLRYVSSFAM